VLRLSPEHLGEVTITLDVRAGGIRLDLAAAPQALAALQADLSQLRDDLANSGLDLGDVTLSAQNPGPGTNGQGAARERWQESAPAGREPAGQEPAGASAAPARRTGSDRLRNGGLDVLA
jgi:flagellar hook-length control protein FliK